MNTLLYALFENKSLATSWKSDWVDLLLYGEEASFQIDTDEDATALGQFSVEVCNKINEDEALGFATYDDVTPEPLAGGAETQFISVSAAKSRYIRIAFEAADVDPAGTATCTVFSKEGA